MPNSRSDFLRRAGAAILAGLMVLGHDAMAEPSPARGSRDIRRAPPAAEPLRPRPPSATAPKSDGFVSKAGEHDDPRLERGM